MKWKTLVLRNLHISLNEEKIITLKYWDLNLVILYYKITIYFKTIIINRNQGYLNGTKYNKSVFIKKNINCV